MISVVLPCKNEEKAIGTCIEKIRKALQARNYEIIVSDSSTDNSPQIAKKLGAKVVKPAGPGYGNAYLEGFRKAKGDIIIMGDADNSYDFLEIPRLLEEINKGYDLVIGSRFSGRIKKRAMPFLHRYLGNPFLSLTLSILFGKKILDAHSGFRAIRRESLDELGLRTKGMEFASEMIIKAIKHKLRIKEIPINYYPRIGDSKLRSFNDGWKHLRFMLLYSPNYLFFLPGIFLLLFGFIIMGVLLPDHIKIAGISLDAHPMVIGSICTILGYQITIMGIFAKTFLYTNLNEKSKFMDNFFRIINLEKTLIFGAIIGFIGILINLWILYLWLLTGFGELNTLKLSIFALTLIIIGIQTVFSGFLLSVLGIQK